METIPIDNERYLKRELSSKAILSTDKASINRYLEQTQVIERNKKQLLEVVDLREEVNRLTRLVEQLLSNRDII